MNLSKTPITTILIVALTFGISWAAKVHEIESAKVGQPPKIDGKADDAAWKKAKEITVEAEDGPELSIRSVYTDKEVFFLFLWEDKDESISQNMWVYDGSKWGIKQEVRFEGEEGWEADSDRLAFQWVINDSIPAFKEKGCKKICHSPEKEDKMYTDSAAERTDIWHWVSSTTNPLGYADDDYLDNSNLTKAKEKDKNKRINIAHKSDDGGRGNQQYERNDAGGKPKFMPKKKGAGFIIAGSSAPLSGPFKKGDLIPGYVLSKPKGSRGDIAAKGKYSADDFLWTLEIKRSLVTNDKKNDVQFVDRKKPYYFGLAVWDNDELYNHTRVKKPMKLEFK
ncbi:MAG: ethylbenzene dehydrogenase-related protein [Nitrospinota bacterium]